MGTEIKVDVGVFLVRVSKASVLILKMSALPGN
jgi:hypothetical protein